MQSEEEFGEGYDTDFKQYFKQLFSSRSFFWQQLKILITPADHNEALLKASKEQPLNANTLAAIIEEPQPVAQEQQELEEEEDYEDDFEIESYDDVEAPKIEIIVQPEEPEENEIGNKILYNQAVPLSLIKEFHYEANSDVVIRAPKPKQKNEPQPVQEEHNAPTALPSIDQDETP